MHVFYGEWVKLVVEPMAERVGSVSHWLGQVLGLGGYFVEVEVDVFPVKVFGASRATIHESGGRLALALWVSF